MYLHVSASQYEILLHAHCVEEVLEYESHTITAANVVWRDQVLPLVDFTCFFGGERNEKSKFITVVYGFSEPVALIVNKIYGLTNIGDDELQQLPPLSKKLTSFFDAVVKQDEGYHWLRFKKTLNKEAESELMASVIHTASQDEVAVALAEAHAADQLAAKNRTVTDEQVDANKVIDEVDSILVEAKENYLSNQDQETSVQEACVTQQEATEIAESSGLEVSESEADTPLDDEELSDSGEIVEEVNATTELLAVDEEEVVAGQSGNAINGEAVKENALELNENESCVDSKARDESVVDGVSELDSQLGVDEEISKLAELVAEDEVEVEASSTETEGNSNKEIIDSASIEATEIQLACDPSIIEDESAGEQRAREEADSGDIVAPDVADLESTETLAAKARHEPIVGASTAKSARRILTQSEKKSVKKSTKKKASKKVTKKKTSKKRSKKK